MTDWGKIASDVVNYGSALLVAAQLIEVQHDYNILAKKYYSNYEIQRRFYSDTFQLQGEGPIVYEQFGVPFYIPDYFGMDSSNSQFPPGAWYLFGPEIQNRKDAMGDSSVVGYWQRYAGRYTPKSNYASVPIILDTSSYAMDMAAIYDDWNSYMNRYEEHKRDVFNERRWANMMGGLGFGIKTGEQIERGLATAFDVFDKAQGQLVSSLDTIGNGLATNAGYRKMQSALESELGTNLTLEDSFFLRHYNG